MTEESEAVSDGDLLLIIRLQAKQKAFQSQKSHAAVDNHLRMSADIMLRRLKKLLPQKKARLSL